MARHQFVKCKAAKQRKHNRAEKTFPRLLPTDVRHHQMPPNRAPRQIRAHVRKLGNRDQVQHIKLTGELTAARTWSEVYNFSDEIEEPKDIQQTEQRVGHRLQGLVVSKSLEHLPSEYRQQKEEENGDFEIVGTCRSDFGEVIKAACEHH